MKYLDYSVLPDILRRFFPDRDQRLVGPDREIDSGYYDLVRFFVDGPDPGRVALDYSAAEFSFRDKLIERYASRTATTMRSEGRLFQGPPAMHLLAADFESKNHKLTLCRCHYDLQAGSCFALDLPDESFHDQGGTLREYYLRNYPVEGHTNPLPACLGVCGLLINNDRDRLTLWVASRSALLASLENSIGPSAAGSVDYDETHRNLVDLAEAAMTMEIEEELALNPNDYRLTLLAFAREIFRGEKPQLFFLIETELDEATLVRHLSDAAIRSGEATEFIRIDLDGTGRIAPSDLLRLNHEAAANLHLAREYLALR